MGIKINLQQLAKTLAQKKGIPGRDAEAFLREFFEAIKQNVSTDKVVKIKGLGTFKLIEVLERESVSVKTGERFVIPGHSKLSFTPEASLKNLINKPFADFQTVVINEGTSIEEMEWLPEDVEAESEETGAEEPASTESPSSQSDSVSQQSPDSSSIQPSPDSPAVQPEPQQILSPEPKEEPAEEPAPEPETVSEPEPKPEPAPEPAPAPAPQKPSSGWMKFLLPLIIVLLLCALGYFIWSQQREQPSTVAPVPEEPKVETPAPEPPAPAPETQYEQVPGGDYKIVGTRKTYVMKPGDFVTRIAIQEYGDKDIAPYIIVHNAFPDPDNVPVGAEIKLPEIVKKE